MGRSFVKTDIGFSEAKKMWRCLIGEGDEADLARLNRPLMRKFPHLLAARFVTSFSANASQK